MNEQNNSQIPPKPPEENAPQSIDEQNGNVDLANAPYQGAPHPPQPQYDYNNYPHEETSGSGCLGIFVKTILIILAVLAFAFFACLFMLSGPC